MTTNWAGNHTYGAREIREPDDLDALAALVAGADRVRGLGSRHSFTDVADTDGVLVSLRRLPAVVEVDAGVARVSAGLLYGEVAAALDARGWALAAMASLPHISVAGAVATGTHGSGDSVGSLASAVTRVEYLAATGELVTVSRGDADFPGSVVSLGALGVVTHLTVAVEPSYEVRQDVYLDLPWEAVAGGLDEVTSAAYSVSLFTDWQGDRIGQAWLKSRSGEPTLPGARAATATVHMLDGADPAAVTEQGGVPGPWHARLPHFRAEFTPSRGAELQSEYLLPRVLAPDAFAALRALAPHFAHLLQISEIRTVAADDLWLSGAYAVDSVALHFTWVLDVPGVVDACRLIEAALLPLGARPHWGKVFATTDVAGLYPSYDDFVALRERVDPTGKFDNAFLQRIFGG